MEMEKVSADTKAAPVWVHFGAGNIFRIFIGGLADALIAKGESNKGITCVETFDFDVIDKIYKPYDNLVLAVTLKADGSVKPGFIQSFHNRIHIHGAVRRQMSRFFKITIAVVL